MRKLVLLCCGLFLCACGRSSAPSETITLPSSNRETPAATAMTEVSTPTASGTLDEDALEAYQNSMEDYEELEVAFLGVSSSFISLDEILERAKGVEAYSVVRSMDESRIFYGERAKYTNHDENVYLLIPALDTDLRVGGWNWYAGEIVDVVFDEKNAKPMIYVESAESLTPLGKIEYSCHRFPGSQDGFLYTGVDMINAKMRTAYHMGVVDITDESVFREGERQFYGTGLMSVLHSYDEVRWYTENGAEITPMEEMLWEGTMYMVFDVDDGTDHHLYGATMDPYTGDHSAIYSDDSGASWHPLAMG